eukprot:s2252_g9.t1
MQVPEEETCGRGGKDLRARIKHSMRKLEQSQFVAVSGDFAQMVQPTATDRPREPTGTDAAVHHARAARSAGRRLYPSGGRDCHGSKRWLGKARAECPPFDGYLLGRQSNSLGTSAALAHSAQGSWLIHHMLQGRVNRGSEPRLVEEVSNSERIQRLWSKHMKLKL